MLSIEVEVEKQKGNKNLNSNFNQYYELPVATIILKEPSLETRSV